MSEPHERLVAARVRAGFASATEAARKFLWNENTYRSHENGERGLKTVVARGYALAFNISLSWLLTGEGDESLAQHVPVIGRIEANGHIQLPVSGSVHFGFISLNFTPVDNTFAFCVNVSTLSDRYREGDMLLCNEHVSIPREDDQLSAIVRLDRRRYLLREVFYHQAEVKAHCYLPLPGVRMPEIISVRRVDIIAVQAIIPRGQYADVSGEHAISDWLALQLKADEIP